MIYESSTLGKTNGIRVLCNWEHLGEHIGNLRGTQWGWSEKTLGTTKILARQIFSLMELELISCGNHVSLEEICNYSLGMTILPSWMKAIHNKYPHHTKI
jgi:hypothetical protein